MYVADSSPGTGGSRYRSVNADRVRDADVARSHESRTAPGSGQLPEVLRHLTMALSGHVQRLRLEGFVVPRELEDLTCLLTYLARSRQEPPPSAVRDELRHDGRMPDRLLVTKAEAAERLGVSLRTVERLAATGRLKQVHVERSARIRVKDLESYVDSLAEPTGAAPASAKTTENGGHL